jgi:dihydropyrimidinase
VRGKDGRRVEYYHRVVVAQWVGVTPPTILDVERIHPGEGEVVAARRLVARVLQTYRRLVDVITADALYLEAPFIESVLATGTHVVIVLKQEARELYQDAERLRALVTPQVLQEPTRTTRLWDPPALTSFPTLGRQIVALGPDEVLPPADRYVDATGKYVLPGPIDCHVHLGGHDDYQTGTLAAARAGLTTLIIFGACDVAGRETLPAAITRLNAEAGAVSTVDFAWHMILNGDPRLLDGIPDALALGVTSFKMFMTYKKRPDRMVSDSFIYRAMQLIQVGGGVAQLHCENGDIADLLEEQLRAAGRVRPADFLASCPEWLEDEAIGRAIAMGTAAGCATYVVHLSTARGLERIKAAQARGVPVWTESCPQYLLLSDAEMERSGPLAKIGPPLRSAGNHDALWTGLADGFIACVASDHAPSPRALKEPGWQNIFAGSDGSRVPFGSPGLGTLVPLVYSEGVVKRGLPLSWMARVLAENPARIFGLYPRKSIIRAGRITWGGAGQGRQPAGDARSGRLPDVAMMKTADFGNLHDHAHLRSLDWPPIWRILLEREVNSRRVIVREVARQDPA